jgi:hypothetical protein
MCLPRYNRHVAHGNALSVGVSIDNLVSVNLSCFSNRFISRVVEVGILSLLYIAAMFWRSTHHESV